ncbi:anthranilate synthase component II [Methylovirgula sp. 4M-Z18]|uniref:anthranilate synthase component II n=1 Tax=Methylovirgula sp. 4M-Z18 TaxID=2293567 RepID=UPI000E2FDD2B|nr:aminodeoxychorismate/anthranilate synthase component II [Methylovirgula sp. 4M-Z18]RFB78339.1 aminodeoxychorismate/anthranilate synthase component II [Methylovirgula sp. 4M-Z18]
MILIIDNYDSFVFNIARYLNELGETVEVKRNDAIDVAAVLRLAPQAVVLSPGPCTPDEAGISLDLVHAASGKIPLLGICLGHQAIGQAFGGTVKRARHPLHGQASAIAHDGTGVFAGLPSPMHVARYHSLIVELPATANDLRATAHANDGELMALAHLTHPTFGVQFHPESIITEQGYALLQNFLTIARDWRQ